MDGVVGSTVLPVCDIESPATSPIVILSFPEKGTVEDRLPIVFVI